MKNMKFLNIIKNLFFIDIGNIIINIKELIFVLVI